MIKRPTVINMSLNALRDLTKGQEISLGEKSPERGGKNSHGKGQVVTQDLITFIKIIAEQRNKAKTRQKRQNKLEKDVAKTLKLLDKSEKVLIPIGVADTVEALLRKYLLCKAEDSQQQVCTSAKLKLSHNRTTNIRAFLFKNNKENTQGTQEQDQNQTDIFRNMTTHKIDREKLVNRNQQLQNEVTTLREMLRQKNSLISKLLSKETHLRRKYNDEFNRLIRNNNIYNISANFQKEEEDGQGRNALNITGRHLIDNLKEDEEKTITMSKNHKTTKHLLKSDSEYIKDNRPYFNKIKNKVHPFRSSKKQVNECSHATQFLKTINKSLPNEHVTRQEVEGVHQKQQKQHFIRQKNTQETEGRPTFQLYINQLESVALSKKHSADSIDVKKQSMISKMKDEQFQTLQLQGFYNQENLNEIDVKSRI